MQLSTTTPQPHPTGNIAHDTFIREMVAHGHRRIAYQKAYPGASDSTARTNACRLLADPQVAAEIRRLLLETRKEALEAIKQQYAGRIADIEEKRAILAQVIRGELVAEKEVTRKGEIQTTRILSDPKDRMRAILIDNKLEEAWQRAATLPDEGLKYWE